MLDLLKRIYDKAEELEGRNLMLTLVVVFIVFLSIGVAINYLTKGSLNNYEFSKNNTDDNTNVTRVIEDTYVEGVVTYIDPRFYPQDNISFFLADKSGKQLILLKAKDQKLEVSEGLFVKVYGKKTQTVDKKNDLLLVERIVVKNGN